MKALPAAVRKGYPSDLHDEEWVVLEPLVPAVKSSALLRRVVMRLSHAGEVLPASSVAMESLRASNLVIIHLCPQGEWLYGLYRTTPTPLSLLAKLKRLRLNAWIWRAAPGHYARTLHGHSPLLPLRYRSIITETGSIQIQCKCGYPCMEYAISGWLHHFHGG